MPENYYQNSLYFRRQVYKLRGIILSGGLNIEKENVKAVTNFLDGLVCALNRYEKPTSKEKSIPKLILVKKEVN